MNHAPRSAPVSANTYQRHGCRCDGCRAAATERQRRARAKGGRSRLAVRATSRATNRAATWVRQHHPDIWRTLLDEAYAELEAEHPDLAIDRRTHSTGEPTA